MMKKLFKNFLLPIAICLLAIGTQAQTTITGNVFNDGNNDGIKGTTEVGYPYVVVNAYAPGATTPTATATTLATPTASVGNYELTGLTAGTKYRLEFVNPTGYYNGAIGTSSKSSVQFATSGATNLNFGFRFAGVCISDANSRIITGMGVTQAAFKPTMASYLNNTTPVSYDMFASDSTGTPWSLASDKKNNLVYFSTVDAPAAKLGLLRIFPTPKDSNSAIYIANYSGSTNNNYVDKKLLVKLKDLGIVVDNTGLLNSNSNFGAVGLGGIDITNDSKYLYVINAGNGKIIKIDISGVDYTQLPITAPNASKITEINIPINVPNPINGNFRPTSLNIKGNTLFIAGVNDGSVSLANSDVQVVVLAMDLSNNNFTKIFEYNTNLFDAGSLYHGGTGDPSIPLAGLPQLPWQNVSTAFNPPPTFQPIVGDFDFDTDGSLIIGVLNRLVFTSKSSQQTGYIVRAQKTSNGYVLESGGTSGNFTNTFAGSTSNLVGPGGMFFYTQSRLLHPFDYTGGVYVQQDRNKLLTGFMDPADVIGTTGVSYYNSVSGGYVTSGVPVLSVKLFAITGIEAVCDMNPIEVGNRVWNDINGNGFQDGDEPSLVGVTVCLYDATNTQVATAITDANGNYIFSSATGTSTSNAKYGLTLINGANYELRICALGAHTSVAGLTLNDVTIAPGETNGQPNTNTTLANNDAFLISGSPTIQFKMGSPGENNHNLDFGFGFPVLCTPPSAGSDATACAGTCMDITGTAPTTGTWSAMAGNPAGATIGATTAGIANVCFDATSTGTYNFIYNIGTSCEDTMSIVVNPQTSNTTTATACDTYTWAVNSTAYTTSGTYTVTSTNANGCVHTEILNLTINASTSNTTTASACNTYTWSVNSTAYTASGTYTETSTNAAGCPHTETLNLTINVPTSSTTNASSCPSSLPYSWNGQSISTAGTYTHNATNAAGCDSVATLVFTISATSTSTTNVTVCTASLPYSWNGQSITSAGAYTYQTTGTTGCDSIATLNLTVADGSVGNYVWSDANNNGTNDEPTTAGINGVTVELWNATTNTLVSSTTTANDGSSNPGYYNFVVCNSGDFKVKFPITNGGNNLTTQTATAGTDGNSDADATTGESPVFTIDVNGVGVAKDNNTIDAGYSIPVVSLPACLGNYVWNDVDHDGTQNNGEVGVSGVTVSLLNGTTNAIMATLTTDAYGYYQFCGLTPATYKVQFSLPTNYVFTGQDNPSSDATDSDPNVFTGITSSVTLASGDNNMTVDAGIYQPQPITATVGNRVWFDNNGDGVQDPNENGVSGITVTLYNCSNPTTPVATTLTDAGGNYLFENIVAGSYQVGFTVPIGMTFTTQSGSVSDATNSDVNPLTERTSCFPVVGGDNITYVDAGIKIKPLGTVSIGDKVWNDVNQDGIQDATETGVAGITVTLYDATGTNVISTTTTNGLGIYGFNGIPSGCYVVGFDLPSGYTRTAQNAGTDTTKNSDANATTGMTNQICLTAGQNNPSIDAGIYNSANTNSIGDKVWYDENHDGLQDVTEYGYPGVVATLYDCTTNTIIATTTTNASGNYLFDGIANGDYYVGFGFVSGFQFTGANSDIAGITGGNNSDANPSNGFTACVNLAGNTHITTVDAGIYPGSNRNATSSIGDIVWTDANNNGLQDNGETGVSNVTVNLYNCSDLNTPISTTTTDGLGNYIFTGLLGGSYVVEFNPTTLPAGYTFTTLGTNIEDENNSDANVTTGKTSCIALGLGEDKMSVDAGIVAPVNTVCLGDYVWIDLDNDGTQEVNEPAVPGVTVKLYDNNTNTVLQVATTNAEGKYLFCGLTNGSTYSVGFENLPAGFTFTTSTGTLATTDNSDANPSTGRTTTVTLGATNDLTLDAGIYSSTTAVVGNYVWYDEDADGIQDATEAPISGVLVTLYNSSNVSVASAVTDANGGYLFTNVTPGDYTIGFAGYPVTLVPTTKGTTNPLTADDDSNIDPITGKTDAFTVLPGSSNLTLDAGYKANPIAGLGNYVWLDVNDNGLQDASEPSISGVVVTLYAANGTTQLGTAITDGNGAYSFPNLTAGDYVVGFSNIPLNLIVATQVGTLNDALNNDITTIDMKTVVITLAAGTYNPNIDAGFKFNPLGAKELKATSAVITSKNDCQVNWFTTDEENTQNFNITRSINGVNFETVGTILASNKTLGRTNYTFQDNIEAVKNAANIFYQIVLNDIDGKQTLSNVISVKTNNINDEISIYPIPFTDVITIDYPSTEASIVSVELTDVSGRIIRTMNQEIEQGNNAINLTGLTNISTGTYFLRIVNNTTGIMYSKKLTK